MHPPGLYYLRGGLSILGIIGFVGFLLLRPKGGAGGKHVVSSGEVDDNFNEAAKRLQASGVKQVAAMPAVFFLGDTDTAKTSVIAKSDIAQLLSGQAQQEVSIVPTRAANFWLAKNTVLVDPAGALLADSDNRKRLFKKFSSVALGLRDGISPIAGSLGRLHCQLRNTAAKRRRGSNGCKGASISDCLGRDGARNRVPLPGLCALHQSRQTIVFSLTSLKI